MLICIFVAGSYNHAMSQQQLRAASHVAGHPYMKSDLSGMGQQPKSPLNDNFLPNYNNGRGGGGPPSPKTKMKIEQQQQQHQHQAAAKMAGMSSMNNLNNLSHIAQMRMNSIGYNLSMGYNPSPIARPQVHLIYFILFRVSDPDPHYKRPPRSVLFQRAY